MLGYIVVVSSLRILQALTSMLLLKFFIYFYMLSGLSTKEAYMLGKDELPSYSSRMLLTVAAFQKPNFKFKLNITFGKLMWSSVHLTSIIERLILLIYFMSCPFIIE